MENTKTPLLTVSDFIAITNQNLEYAFSSIQVEGEVASFKVNQGKYVFFDIKDEAGSVGCFMTVWQLRQPLEDGMKVVVTATPKLTAWGKFSLTVREVRLSGEGSLRRGLELLKAKLEKEGLFKDERKRPLPDTPKRIAVISSTQAAGFADFMKIVDDRWGGLSIDVAHVQVQGSEAPDQMIRALRHINSRQELPEVIVLIRGGGSAEDLSAFNDEALVREIAASRVPTLVGVGHETDSSLADLVADVRASTPSNAAQIVVPDKQVIIDQVNRQVRLIPAGLAQVASRQQQAARESVSSVIAALGRQYDGYLTGVYHRRRVLAELDPNRVLGRGYAIISGEIVPGGKVRIEKSNVVATAEVIDVKNR